MIGPGALTHRLVLQAPLETSDGAGGVVRTYQTEVTLWARLTPLRARDGIVAAGEGATVTHRIVLRAGREITTRHRFRLGARVFRIVSVRDIDGRGRFVEIEAQERQD